MAEWTFPIPDDLDARVRSHLARRDGDLAEFVSQAVREQLTYEADAALQDEIAESIRRGMADVEAGRVSDAREAMREIAREKGINLPR